MKSRLTIRDFLIATAIFAVWLVVMRKLMAICAAPASLIDASGEFAGEMCLLFTCGLVVFPLSILLVGIVVLRHFRSPLSLFYVILILLLSIYSVRFAYVVARACAYAIA